MSFPLTLLGLVVLIAAFVFSLKVIAEWGDRPAARHLQRLRDSTPIHHQGREADFDEHGRPW